MVSHARRNDEVESRGQFVGWWRIDDAVSLHGRYPTRVVTPRRYFQGVDTLLTVLFTAGLSAELCGAGIVFSTLLSNQEEMKRASEDERTAPIVTALLGAAGGFTNRWSADAALHAERDGYRRAVNRLARDVQRQKWAFVLLVFGAACGFAANLIDVWR